MNARFDSPVRRLRHCRWIAHLLIVIALFGISRMGAQDLPSDIGFVRIVHAIAPGEGNASYLINGENIFPTGYKLGQKTGGIGIQAGHHEISVNRVGVETGTTKLDLKSGETISLIAFAEKIPLKEQLENDAQPAEPRWRIKLLRLRQSDPKNGYRISFISVSDKSEIPLTAHISGRKQPEAVFVKRLDLSTLELGNIRGEISLEINGERVAGVSTEDPGNYVVVIYDDAAGIPRVLTFYDPKFVVAG